MGELLVLDPSEVATDRVEVDITALVGPEGPDFGDAAIEAALAEQGMFGQSTVDYRVPNRTVAIPLVLREHGGHSFEENRLRVQAKAALFQREGGWLKRETALGPVYADVDRATLKLGAKNAAAWGFADADAVLTLECLPDWYGDEISLDAISETTNPEIVRVLTEGGSTAVIRGDYPGRCRIVVTDTQGQLRLGLIWGVRSRYYDAANTAALAYEAEGLTPLDTAAVATLSGASGGASNNVVSHTNLAGIWTPVLSTQIASVGHMTHLGTYRVYARMQASASSVRARLVWDVGDLALPTANTPWAFPAGDAMFIADLGEIHVERVGTSGTHRWAGQIQAQGESGDDIHVDRVWIIPVAEGGGRMVTAPNGDFGLSTFSARDEFIQAAGALTGKAAAIGGTWTAFGGDSDDWTIDTTGQTAQRATVADSTMPNLASAAVGRAVTAGTSSLAAISAQVDFKHTTTAAAAGVASGLLLRAASTSAYAVVSVSSSTASDLLLFKYASGIGTSDILAAPLTRVAPGNWYTLRVVIDADGRYFVWVYPSGSTPGSPVATGTDSDFATGGALASGKFGIYDGGDAAIAVTRDYDNFAVWSPAQDAVIYANRAAEIRTDRAVRQDSAGTSYGPVARVIGDRPRVPASGLEGRPVELFVKASRGDLGWLPDTGIDDLSVQVFYRPSYLFVPEG